MEKIKEDIGFDWLIDSLVGEFKSNNEKAPRYLVLTVLGSVVLKELLDLDYTMELPNSYKGLKILYTFDEQGEVAEVI